MKKTYTLKSGRAVQVTASNKRVSNTWGGRHYAYTATISVDGEEYRTTFHDSVANFGRGISYPEGMTDDILGCVVLDASSFEEYPVLHDFLHAYGYDAWDRAGIKAWEGCREASEHLRRMLSQEDMEELFQYQL